MRSKITYLNTILCFVFLLGLSSCKEIGKQEETASESGEQILLQDVTGRDIKLDGIPERIVVIGKGTYMPIHLMIMFPEAVDTIVAVESKTDNISTFLEILHPNFDAIMIEWNAGPEQIAAYAPDLVIAKGYTETDVAKSLSLLDIPVVYLGMETPQQYEKDIRLLGKIFANGDRAEEIVDFYETKLGYIEDKVSELKDSEKPEVLVLEYNNRAGDIAVNVPPEEWIQTQEVKMAGGNPIWVPDLKTGSGWQITNFEQIALWDAKQIFLIVSFPMDPEEVFEELKNDSQWEKLQAVRDEQLYVFPTDLNEWDNPDPRWLLGTTWLAKRMHPDLFQDLDMKTEIIEYFSTLYGMDKASIESTIFPEIKVEFE
ncbi:MAG: ABC transporter substrate-binding protein [Anaerolineaceae bacterium]|nr:ABC transporter substrate-binding protein [Anaerolineaceae bacterium]